MSRKFKFKSAAKRKKIQLLGFADDIVDRDMIKGAHIEMFSNKEIVIHGCVGVFEYNTDYIRLNLGKGTMVLCGNNFDIVLFEGDVITVKGNISSVEFCV